jgi:hypothetical protein
MKSIIAFVTAIFLPLAVFATGLTESQALQEISNLIPAGSGSKVEMKGKTGSEVCYVAIENNYGVEVSYYQLDSNGRLNSRTLFDFQTTFGRKFVAATSTASRLFVKYLHHSSSQIVADSYETVDVKKLNDVVKSITVSNRDGSGTCKF